MARKLAALVIGNATYASAGTLKNPTHDAIDMETTLARFGFSVIPELPIGARGPPHQSNLI